MVGRQVDVEAGQVVGEPVVVDPPSTTEEVRSRKDVAQGDLSRKGTTLSSMLQRAGTVSLQRADSLPVDNVSLRHAATMPGLMDVAAERPFCCGLWKVQQLVGAVLGVVLAIVFLLVPLPTMYTKAGAMLSVLCLVACSWLFEVLPIYVTALMPVVFMPLFMITSSDIAASAYWNWVQLLLVGAFLVDIAMEHVQLPRRILLQVLLRTGSTRGSLVLAGFMFVAWLLSTMCSDIAVTLMLAPFATSFLNTAEEEAIVADLEKEHSTEDLAQEGDEPNVGPRQREVRRFATGLMLGIAYASSAGGIATIIGTPVNALMAGQRLAEGNLSFFSWFLFALPISVCVVVLAFVVLYVTHVRGATLPLRHEVIVQEYDDLVSEIGHFSSDEMSVGLIQVLLLVLLCLQPVIDRVVVNPLGYPLSGSASTACLCALLLFIIPSKVRRGESLLTWQVTHEKLPWGVLLLVGGGFSLAHGFESSGLGDAAGEALGHLVMHLSPLALSFVISFLTVILIQLMNNIATAAWLLPVLGNVALQSLTNPMQLMLPAAIACSLSFMFPTASPSNAIMLGKSRDLATPLRIRDFFKCGLPLTVLAAIVSALLSCAMGQAVFASSEPFPKNICDLPSINCVWVNVAGEVDGGKHEEGQACVPLDSYDGKYCRLWSGDLHDLQDSDLGMGQPGVAPTPHEVSDSAANESNGEASESVGASP